jgi:hypothetical protein
MDQKERLAAVKEIRFQQQMEILVEMHGLKETSCKIARVTKIPYHEVREIRRLINRAEKLKEIESRRLNSYRRLKREYNVQNFHLNRGW